MNRDFGERWVAALRSGRYEQGVGFLRTGDNRYCCLGVAADLLAQDSSSPRWAWRLMPSRDEPEVCCIPDVYTIDGMISTPHEVMRDIIGLTWYQQEHLIHLNDEEGASFAAIADYLERELSGESVTNLSRTVTEGGEEFTS